MRGVALAGEEVGDAAQQHRLGAEHPGGDAQRAPAELGQPGGDVRVPVPLLPLQVHLAVVEERHPLAPVTEVRGRDVPAVPVTDGDLRLRVRQR